MLLRFTLSAAGALVLASTATAQLHTTNASPITSTVKDAGVYHLATGTWTRGVNASALAGPEVIYDNTCTVGYYFGLTDGERVIDSGRIPSTSSPVSTTSLAGTHDLYEVNGFTFAYCSFEPSSTNMDLSFIDCYQACDGGGVDPVPTVTFNIVNAPAGTASGGQGCWILTFDLANTTAGFNLGGDCNGNYDNIGSTDSFGWGWTQTIPTTGSNAGPIFGGDPSGLFPQTGQTCGGIGGGTTFVGASAAPGTGIGLVDQMDLVNGAAPGCYWFGGYGGAGGNPFTAFYLQLQGAEGFEPTSGTPYCVGDGTGAACPCGNNGAAGQGCANSSGGGATMSGSGSASMSNDTLAFTIAGVAGAKPGLLLRGNNQVNGGLGNGVGDGLICAAGGSQRSQVQITDASGATTFSAWNGNGLGSVANAIGTPTYFQFWYRDPMGGPCNTGFNFSNAWDVTYGL